MPPFRDFTFTVPSLPKPVYDAVRDLCKEYSVSQWHTVIAGVIAMVSMDPAARKILLDKVQTTYLR